MNTPQSDAQANAVTFTRDEWEDEHASEAFGVKKVIPKEKKETPGMKAILVFTDSFRRAKKRMKEYTSFRPVLDLPEVISAMIDVCDADPALMTKVSLRILERREQQLAEMKTATTPVAP